MRRAIQEVLLFGVLTCLFLTLGLIGRAIYDHYYPSKPRCDSAATCVLAGPQRPVAAATSNAPEVGDVLQSPDTCTIDTPAPDCLHWPQTPSEPAPAPTDWGSRVRLSGCGQVASVRVHLTAPAGNGRPFLLFNNSGETRQITGSGSTTAETLPLFTAPMPQNMWTEMTFGEVGFWQLFISGDSCANAATVSIKVIP